MCDLPIIEEEEEDDSLSLQEATVELPRSVWWICNEYDGDGYVAGART